MVLHKLKRLKAVKFCSTLFNSVAIHAQHVEFNNVERWMEMVEPFVRGLFRAPLLG